MKSENRNEGQVWKNMRRLLVEREYVSNDPGPEAVEVQIEEKDCRAWQVGQKHLIVTVPALRKQVCESLARLPHEHLVIVCNTNRWTDLDTLRQMVRPGVTFETIPYTHLRFWILDLASVPAYKLLKRDEYPACICDRDGTVDRKHCLTMRMTDPVAVVLGARPGDVLRETKSCSLAGPRDAFRFVSR